MGTTWADNPIAGIPTFTGREIRTVLASLRGGPPVEAVDMSAGRAEAGATNWTR
jgi:hypothetical protein